MMDEDKQVNQSGESQEVQQTMTNESPAEMNMNESASAAAEQVAINQQQAGGDTSSQQENPSLEAPAAVDPAVVSELNRQVESLKAQVEERSNQYVRIAADFENFRKRSQKEKEEQELQIKRNTIMELLPIVDNFERARAQIKPQTDAEMAIHKSYQSVYKQLVECLKRLGVAPMRPEGAEFDPNLHEAVMREHTDEYPEGTVLEELVRGYYLGDRVLRHAMVKVAAPSEDATPSESQESNPANT